MGEVEHTVVRAVFFNIFHKPLMPEADVLNTRSGIEGVVWWLVKEVYSGGCAAWVGTIDKIECV